MDTDTRVEAHTLNDLLGIQSLALCVGVKFIEIRDAQSKIGVSEQLDCLSEAHEQRVDILFGCAFLKQFSEGVRSLCQTLVFCIRANDYPAGEQIIV